MSALFAPSDIEKLVANFPPLSISANGRPRVVRSFSKNNLKNSAEVLGHFKVLVERHDQRILKSSLAATLGIEESSESTILDQLELQLYYSADGRHIIPHTLIENIAAVLKDRASRVAVNLHAFSCEQDIRTDSLDRLIEDYSGKDWARVIIGVDATAYLCSYEYSENVKVQVHNATSDAGQEICNLSSIFGHGIPAPIIAALATEATSGKNGQVKFSGEQVVYVPTGYNDVAAQQSEQKRAVQVASLVEHLEQHGFCAVRESAGEFVIQPTGKPALVNVVIAEFQSKRPNSLRPAVVDMVPEAEATAGDGSLHRDTKIIVRPETLCDELDNMKSAVGTRAGILWHSNFPAATPANIVRNLQHSDFETQHKEDLADLLIRSLYAKELEVYALNCLSELESKRHDQFVELISTRLWIPLHCYAAGVLEIRDTALKQHLEDFLTIHFKSDSVPSTMAMARDQGFLNDKARKRDTDKLLKSTEEAKAFADIQKSLAKFRQKLKVPTPTDSQIFAVKSATIQATTKSMSRLKRGSDVLQNLIWVLLATSGPGLFMSSGRDTSRMIKHYDAVCGDPEVAGMLAIWRDKLKQGAEDEDDMRQMRELAKAAVGGYAKSEAMSAHSGT